MTARSGRLFCNVVTDDLGFETEDEKKAAEERDVENKELLDFVKESVGDAVASVKLSRKLTNQPCCLTTEGGVTLEMEKYFRHGPSEEMRKVRATRVLELNGEHHAFQALKAAWEAGDSFRFSGQRTVLIFIRRNIFYEKTAGNIHPYTVLRQQVQLLRLLFASGLRLHHAGLSGGAARSY